MTETLTLAIDQGTHATRALVFDGHGRVLAHARRPVSLQVHSRTEIEQSPVEILDSLQAVVKEILQQPGIDAARIGSAGLATQRSSVLAWDRVTGRALSPVLSWQDTRSAANLEALGRHEAAIRERTGLRLSPHYGAGKLNWLLRHETEVIAARERGVLTIITLRIVPVAPFTVINIIAGISEIRLRDFAIGSFIGMVPGVMAISLLADRIIASLIDRYLEEYGTSLDELQDYASDLFEEESESDEEAG